jgi:FixJ family two-component response regulator
MEKVEERLARLTPRERQVLIKIMDGLLNKEIASALAITERTVKQHKANIMDKMGTRSTVRLARMCFEVHRVSL